jgi:hypothetical protein
VRHADTASVESVSDLMEGRSARRVARRSETTTAGSLRKIRNGVGGPSFQIRWAKGGSLRDGAVIQMATKLFMGEGSVQ